MKCCGKKTVAAWFSGVFAAVAICHAALAITGKTIAPFGITLTRNLNIIGFVVAAIISILLCVYGCKKK